jgi:hypothetical protein
VNLLVSIQDILLSHGNRRMKEALEGLRTIMAEIPPLRLIACRVLITMYIMTTQTFIFFHGETILFQVVDDISLLPEALAS